MKICDRPQAFKATAACYDLRHGGKYFVMKSNGEDTNRLSRINIINSLTLSTQEL